jgi:hypothetical protein
LICWDQIQSGKEEVESWLNTMETRLDDSLNNFDDAISVESCLMKFKVRIISLQMPVKCILSLLCRKN